MIKQYKHPMHILVIDKEFTDELPGMNLKQGVTRFTQVQYTHWLDHAAAHLMTGLREKMEYDPRFRQILPYTPVIFSDTPQNIDWANSPLFLYQRTKKVGEERLAGNHSIGTGGHVDNDDVKSRNSIINFGATIDANLAREVACEELLFTLKGEEVNPISHPQLFDFVPFGLLRDDSNNVGKVHLGVVNVIVVPTQVRAQCKEDELITCQPMTATELKASGLNFEGWTQILIDEMCGLECSVKATPAREVQYDIVAGQYFIETKKGDKWTELAIEFNTTVAALYRLNVSRYDSNDIDEGTRVIVPEPQQDMVKVETPQHVIDALNDDKAGARAKIEKLLDTTTNGPLLHTTEELQARMTETVLRGIHEHGPDYKNVGMRFLVSQSMADDLVARDPQIIALIDAGVVVITSPESIDGAAIATAELNNASGYLEMPNPSDKDLKDPVFNAIWDVIKKWDVNVPSHYAGYCGANGSHVMLILDEVRKVKTETQANESAA